MNKTIASIFIGIVALSLLWTGCDECGAEAKRTYEYSFENGTAPYVPYAVGDSFYMVDSLGNSLTYAIMSSEILPEEAQCECCPLERMDKLFLRANKNAMADGLVINLLQEGEENVRTGVSLRVALEGSNFDFAVDSGNTASGISPTTFTKYNSMSIGSHTFLNVFELHNTMTDSTKANVIWYNVQNGLLRFKKVNGEVWSLP